MELKNIEIIEEVYSHGDYSVYTGFMTYKDAADLVHYLIVNRKYKVAEASSSSLVNAREMAYDLDKAAQAQNALIDRKEPLYEEPKGGSGKLSFN